jgi:hypothetical protein
MTELRTPEGAVIRVLGSDRELWIEVESPAGTSMMWRAWPGSTAEGLARELRCLAEPKVVPFRPTKSAGERS